MATSRWCTGPESSARRVATAMSSSTWPGRRTSGIPRRADGRTQAGSRIHLDEALTQRPPGEAPRGGHVPGDRRARGPAPVHACQPGAQDREVEVGQLRHPLLGGEAQEVRDIAEVGPHGVGAAAALVAQVRGEARQGLLQRDRQGHVPMLPHESRASAPSRPGASGESHDLQQPQVRQAGRRADPRALRQRPRRCGLPRLGSASRTARAPRRAGSPGAPGPAAPPRRRPRPIVLPPRGPTPAAARRPRRCH